MKKSRGNFCSNIPRLEKGLLKINTAEDSWATAFLIAEE